MAEAVHTQTGHSEEGADQRDSEQQEVAELSKDDLFHILQNQRRRRILQYIKNSDEDRIDMRDIAEQVAAWEHETTVQQLTSSERQRVYIALYQSHLPKLHDKGIIEYNQSRGIVERTPLADQFSHYLDAGSHEKTDVEPDGDEAAVDAVAEPVTKPFDSARYYGGATALCLALTLASWGGVTPAAMSGYLAPFVTGLFLAITAGVTYRNRL